MSTPKFLLPPEWDQLRQDQQESMRELFGVTTLEFAQKCYEDQLAKIREYNAQLDEAPRSDAALAEELTAAVDAIEKATDRLAKAIVRKIRPRNANAVDHRHARENIERAVRLFREDIEALSDDAYAQHRADIEEMHRWSKAQHEYKRHAESQRRDGDKIRNWSVLSDEEQQRWYDYVDDRVPPTWDEMTTEARLTWAGGRGLPDGLVRPLYGKWRADKIRRKAALRIDLAGAGYRVPLDPDVRMRAVVEIAVNLSWAKREYAHGRMPELQVAVWAEHYRRAYHAYTHPFEPYEVP